MILLSGADYARNNVQPFLFPIEIPHTYKFGYMDRFGKIAVNPDLDEALPYENNIAIFRKGNLFGFLNPEGEFVDSRFEAISGCQENLVLVQSGGKWGYTDLNGNYVIPPRFEEAFLFSEGLAKVMINKKYGRFMY